MSKKATRSRNQRLFLMWLRVSKKQCHCRIEWIVEHNEYGNGVAREGSTPILLWRKSHLKYFMKFDYTLDSAILTSQLNRSYPVSMVFQRIIKAYKEVESGRIRMRKNWECTLGIHCKWWRNRQCVPVKKLTKINRLKTLGPPNLVHPHHPVVVKTNWCETSCAKESRPIRDYWGPHSEHTPQSHLR